MLIKYNNYLIVAGNNIFSDIVFYIEEKCIIDFDSSENNPSIYIRCIIKNVSYNMVVYKYQTYIYDYNCNKSTNLTFRKDFIDFSISYMIRVYNAYKI